MSTILSLVCFCPECLKQGQPKSGTPFVVFGSHQNKFHVYTVEHHGTFGYTPHLVNLVKVIGENVIYEKTCGICGVDIWENPQGDLCFLLKTKERCVATLKQWNDWVLYKTDSDFWI